MLMRMLFWRSRKTRAGGTRWKRAILWFWPVEETTGDAEITS